MASRDQLIQALKKADEAGDMEGAATIAEALKSGSFDNTNQGRSKEEVLKEYHSKPWYGKMGSAFDDAARLIASGMTAGYSDNIAGALNNVTGLDEGGAAAEKAKTDEARMRMGAMSLPYEFLGMLAPSSKLSAGAAMIPGAGGAGMASSALREGIAGAAYSGGAAGSDVAAGRGDASDIGYDAVTGFLGGAAGGAIGSKVGDALNWAGKKLGIKAPAFVDETMPPLSVDDMAKAKDGAYKAVEDMGTRYNMDEYNTMVQKLMDRLNKEGISPDFHSKSLAMLGRIQREGTRAGDLSPRNLDDLRRMISRDVTDAPGSKTEGHMAKIMKEYLDDFIEQGPTTTGANAPSAEAASDSLKYARDLNRRKNLLEDIDERIFKGENAASEHGDVNALRSLLNNKKKRQSMSRPEIDALMKVVRGDNAEKFLRQSVAGVPLTPLGTGIVVGGATGNPVAGILSGAGVASMSPVANKIARSHTNKNIKALMDTVGMGYTQPAMSRKVLPDVGQALGVLAAEPERRKKRKKKR